jgi:hypothetical protein
MELSGNQNRAWIDDELQFGIVDEENPLQGGGVAYVVNQGRIGSQAKTVKPIGNQCETLNYHEYLCS